MEDETLGEKPSTDLAEQELRVLMSEKEQADRQIGAYLELQVKVHTVIFTAAAVAAGWIFAQHEGAVASMDVRGAAILALAFLGSFAVLQGIINFGDFSTRGFHRPIQPAPRSPANAQQNDTAE